MNAPVSVGAMDRQKYIGGSDIAGILGISPWKTPLDVYLDKVQPRVEITDPDKLRVLNRGKRMEPYVIDLLSEETGLEIVRRGERYLDRELSFIAAEIDAEAASGENIEIKTVDQFNRLLAQFDKAANVTLLVRRGELQTFVTIKGLSEK